MKDMVIVLGKCTGECTGRCTGKCKGKEGDPNPLSW